MPSYGVNDAYCDDAVLKSMPIEELERYGGIVAFFAIYNIIGFDSDPEHPLLMCFMEDHLNGGKMLKFSKQTNKCNCVIN